MSELELPENLRAPGIASEDERCSEAAKRNSEFKSIFMIWPEPAESYWDRMEATKSSIVHHITHFLTGEQF